MTNLKQVRLQKGLSQSQLAEKSGVGVRMLQEYEQGRKAIDGAKLNTLLNLANALDCKLHEILQDNELVEKAKTML